MLLTNARGFAADVFPVDFFGGQRIAAVGWRESPARQRRGGAHLCRSLQEKLLNCFCCLFAEAQIAIPLIFFHAALANHNAHSGGDDEPDEWNHEKRVEDGAHFCFTSESGWFTVHCCDENSWPRAA
jgi:hypothetical protein